MSGSHNTIIRKAELEDAAVISRLISSLSHLYLQDSSAQLPEWFAKTLCIAELERRLKDSHFEHYVFLTGSEITGYIAIKDGHHLYHLFVAEHQQRKGIAKQLWKHASTTSDTYTVRSSINAIPFYKHLGFKESAAQANKSGIAYQCMTFVREMT
ncbi:GNAT family N-acetyltransferase [Agaribacterium sp. ZY112]|uniref:GNAT family N-acetyltransferase n=1 Tax=Agaribacterium sp. ZY112 TaxID=3233574 RepID=UPI0035262574